MKTLEIRYLKDFDSEKFINDNKDIINNELKNYLEPKYPIIIWESMAYTVLSGGKRIRPLLMMESARACGGDIKNVIPTACALEMVHAYSLIHDDLPCMDNDDYRRGRLTNHKVYGESFAVLAGDSLLSLAPQMIIRHTPDTVEKQTLLKVLDEFFTAIGPSGLVGGQVVDIHSEGKDIDFATFEYIHTHKTGELFRFALRAGALLSNASEEKLEALTEYGKIIGYAFQVADDILDIIGTREDLGKTPGKDQKSNKKTHPSLYGLNNSIEEVERLCGAAQKALTNNGVDTPALMWIAGNIAAKVRG